MEKQFFFYRLNPPRPDFHLNQSETERRIMSQHTQYWIALTEKGNTIVYGPVFDPKGVFGMGIIEVDNAEQADTIGKEDPAVSSKLCTCELIPMQVGMMR